MSTKPQRLERQCEWTALDVANSDEWTLKLSAHDLSEIDNAVQLAKSSSDDLLSIEREDFPLPNLSRRLRVLENELINGRGFGLIRGVDRAAYSNDDMCLIYWGIGAHLGTPWPQNKHGHLLGDVTDQGRGIDDPEARGNELGGIPLPFHTDGSDLVGLMCLENGIDGGESAICNSVAVYNQMVTEVPDLAAELFKPQPYDFRGEQAPGGKPWYLMPVFTEHQGRLFVRYIRGYILASQRHESAPRITEKAEQAMQYLDRLIDDPKHHVCMALRPGDMQFINNYHVLHGRKAYRDDRPSGRIR
ncbi:MAG: TauD/TfdA family dioxygenase, partial [Pseudomonadota bacterium]